MISDLMLQRNLSLLNDGSATYLHPGSGSQTAIDLSICDPLLYLDFSWKVHNDLLEVIISQLKSTLTGLCHQ